jgi:thiol-disulfide isomerase/thioredoxin
MHARVLREQQNFDDDASSLSLYVSVLFSIHHTTNRLCRQRQRQLFILLYIAFTRTTVHLIVINNNNNMSLAVPLPSSSSSSTCSPSWEALVSTLKSKGILKSPSNGDASPSPCETVADLMTKSGAQQKEEEENDDNQQQQQPLLLVLVGGSWCAPCRNFTPVLKDCTSNNNNSNDVMDNVKVLFCSADHDDDSFWSYFGQMPASWSAVPYDQDEEDERDDLLEALHANSLPTLLVLDPLTGTLLEKNAVHAVQASGSGDGFAALIDKWRSMAQSGEAAAAAAAVAATTTNNNSTSSSTTANAGEETKEDNDDKTTLKYFIPAPPSLICQYFKERLISPDLPEALKSVILRRHAVVAQEDEAAKKLADTILGDADNDERWLFRTAAPALPMNWYGSSVLGNIEANAIECWTVERNDDAADNNNNNNIRKATCIIENETGRMILVFRETIVMEATKDGHGTNVTKTLNLNGVPSMGHGPFQRRWKAESELIFHALLGSCDRKKSSSKA